MIAIVDITSFRGMSVEAIHFYGRLIIRGSENIELFRAINKNDLDNYPDRFYGYEVGDLTRCFDTWRDVVKKQKKKTLILKIS